MTLEGALLVLGLGIVTIGLLNRPRVVERVEQPSPLRKLALLALGAGILWVGFTYFPAQFWSLAGPLLALGVVLYGLRIMVRGTFGR